MKRVLVTLALLTAAITTIASCGDDAASEPTGSSRGFNSADVRFATAMIPHHAQALSMVDLTSGKKMRRQVATLAEEIRMAQAPEIERMAAWLDKWGRPIPATGRDHAGHDMGATGMPGMASSEDMAALARANVRADVLVDDDRAPRGRHRDGADAAQRG